jgi:hypothetical protein
LAETYKRLGAVDVNVDTNTVLYTVPSGKSAVVSSVNVCNRGAQKALFRIAHVDGALEDLLEEDYIYYEIGVDGPDTFEATRGITMSEGDSLIVRSSKATVNFIAWGCEIDVV